MLFKGKVKTVTADKGFGFVAGPENNAFFHISKVGTEWFQRMREGVGDTVFEYEAIFGPNNKGIEQWQVTKILRVVEDDPVVMLLGQILKVLEEIRDQNYEDNG